MGFGVRPSYRGGTRASYPYKAEGLSLVSLCTLAAVLSISSLLTIRTAALSLLTTTLWGEYPSSSLLLGLDKIIF